MTKVICAMSGGLDSSVAAALLKMASFDVVGVFMKFWSLPKEELKGEGNRCYSLDAERMARRVAKILKIPFYVFNFEKEFKKIVVDDFLRGYKNGITPNPCVVCNKEIKFGLLLEKALGLDSNYVATGHYARLKQEIQNSKFKIKKLLRAKDRERDQSYFLWMLNQNQLKKILFPVGNLTKKEVKKLARKFKLPVLKAKKSVEICFIQGAINDFLRKYLKEKPGRVVDVQGKILGEHKGLWFYTIGQRKGISLSGGPYYVLDKDFGENLLIVTKNKKDLFKKELVCEKVNWISEKEPELPFKVKAKIRYRHQLFPAVITKSPRKKIYRIKFNRSQCAITPGQSVVFYKNQEVVGGGIIC